MAVKSPRPRELYRDPAHGKIAGICAGLGRYFDWPVWPIRLALVLLAVFTQFFPLVAVYLIAWFVLDPVTSYSPPGLRGQVDGWVRTTRSRWDQGESAPVEDISATATDGPESTAQPEAVRRPAARGGAMPAQTAAAADSAWLLFPPDLDSVEQAYAELEQRVQALERHVTEPAFVLREQFRRL